MIYINFPMNHIKNANVILSLKTSLQISISKLSTINQ